MLEIIFWGSTILSGGNWEGARGRAQGIEVELAHPGLSLPLMTKADDMYTAATDTAAVTGTDNGQWPRQAKQESY